MTPTNLHLNQLSFLSQNHQPQTSLSLSKNEISDAVLDTARTTAESSVKVEQLAGGVSIQDQK